jgi:membrane protease YdiL (CAAX protease family)
VVVCSGFPTQLLVVAVLSLLRVPARSPDGELSLAYIAWLSLVDAVMLVGLCLVFLRARGERPRTVLLGARSPFAEAGVGLLFVPVAFALVIFIASAIERFAPWLRSPEGNPLEALMKNPARIVVFACVAMLAGGIREEVQRAFVLHRFEQHLGGAALGLVLFSAVFGLGHVIQGWDATILTGVLGAFWGIVYLRRRSIVAPAVCHALFNGIEVVYHGLVP